MTKFILLDVTLSAIPTFYLRDILIKRVEQGVPLEHLDLRTCKAANRAIKLLAEIVVDVQEPPDEPTMATEYFNLHGRIEYGNRVEFDNRWERFYSNSDDSDEDEYSEYEDEDEDDEDEMDYY